MDVHRRLGLSKEAFNRLHLWHEALHNALRYLKVGDHIRDKPNALDDWCEYEGPTRRAKARTAFIAQSGLTEAALIMVRQVFSTGREGPGVAGNHNPEVERLRKEMQQATQQALAWTDEEYADQYGFFRDQRNYFLAHYDGTQADYHEPNEHIASMKMVGANLSASERDKLEALVMEMLRWLECRLYPARPTGE